MDGFEMGTAALAPEQLVKNYLSLGEDKDTCVEWQWHSGPGELLPAFDQIISSTDPLRVQLWRDDEGLLHLRIGI